MPQHTFLISGCGGAGRNVAKVATGDGRGRIIGLYDPQPAQVAQFHELYPDATLGDDFSKILIQTNPDVVVVAGPDHLHAEQTLLALEHGCHVMVEKPLATTVADAQRILDAEAVSGRQVMADHTMRYLHPWGQMARIARTGGIGELFFIQGDYIHDMWSYYSPQGAHHTPWRIDPDNPQNILLGGGCHPIDLMLWTVGTPVEEVFAYSNKLSAPDFPSEDCYILALRFANGILGKVFVTSGCSGHGMGDGMGAGLLAAYGTGGTLWMGKQFRRDEEPVPLEDTAPQSAVGGHGWGQSVVEFLDCLDGRRTNPIPAWEGANVVAVCEAALKSIATGQPQRPIWFGESV